MPSVLLASDRCSENLAARHVGNHSHVLFLYNPTAAKIFFFNYIGCSITGISSFPTKPYLPKKLFQNTHALGYSTAHTQKSSPSESTKKH